MLRRQQKKLEWIKPASHFTLVMSALQLHLNTILKKMSAFHHHKLNILPFCLGFRFGKI